MRSTRCIAGIVYLELHSDTLSIDWEIRPTSDPWTDPIGALSFMLWACHILVPFLLVALESRWTRSKAW